MQDFPTVFGILNILQCLLDCQPRNVGVYNIETHFINCTATYWPEKPISSVTYLTVIQLRRRSIIHCYANIGGRV